MRDVGLDANAGYRRSVKIQNKREQKCRKRNAHIKVIQNGLKSKHQTMKLFKTGTLPAVAFGHAGMGMCPISIQHKRTMAADSCGKRIKTARTTTILHFTPWKWYPAENPDVDRTYSGRDPGPFLSEMQQRLSHKVWEQAALHYHGLGAENGVNMTILHKHYKQLLARGAHVKAGMLYRIATAQIYDGSRVCESSLLSHLLVPWSPAVWLVPRAASRR